jgi:two-component system, LuxR family, response regulator FixJ
MTLPGQRLDPGGKQMNRGHVFLIDNDASRCDSLAAVLEQHCEQLHKFGNAVAFLDGVDYERLPDAACVLTHLDLTPLSGLELLDVFRADRITLPSVLIASPTELQLAVKAMRYGGTYILWRPFTASQLIEVVTTLLREWSAAPVAAPAVHGPSGIEERFATLSRRQRQVLRHVFEGNGNRAIADALGISVKTVELHRACMMKKMHADSVVALIRMMSDLHRCLEQCA